MLPASRYRRHYLPLSGRLPFAETAAGLAGARYPARVVTAKSIASGNIESYGMAVPAPELDGFLKKHLPDYQPAAARARSLQWDEVDRLVSPAVMMVLKAL